MPDTNITAYWLRSLNKMNDPNFCNLCSSVNQNKFRPFKIIWRSHVIQNSEEIIFYFESVILSPWSTKSKNFIHSLMHILNTNQSDLIFDF